MIDKIDQAIRAINPNAKYTMTNGIENIEWLEGTAPISVSDINSKIDELKYQRDREKEYPSWQDQMDMQYHDKVHGTSTWQTAIAKVKSDNPKE